MKSDLVREKEDLRNNLTNKNEQLKKDITRLINENEEFRSGLAQQNKELKELKIKLTNE